MGWKNKEVLAIIKHNTMKKIINIKNIIKNSWAWNHKHAVFSLTMTVALLWQTFGDLVPLPEINWSDEIVAVNEKLVENPDMLPADCDYKCLTTAWVELRTEEIMTEGMEDYRKQSRIKALIEANEMITEI